MKELFQRTKMLDEAKLQSKGRRPIIEMLLFFLVFGIASTAQSIILYPALMFYIYSDKEFFSVALNSSELDVEKMLELMNKMLSELPEWIVLVNLFSTAALIVAVIIYCRFIEKRSLASMGIRKRGAVVEYIVGLAVGVVLFGLAVGIGVLTGAFEFKGLGSFSVPVIVLYFIGFIIQGASEELLIHGYYMTSVSRTTSTGYALVTSSIMFALLHWSNNGIGFVALINLFLFGLLAGIYVIKRGNIWGVCAIHTVWNFVQGNVFGLSVSGMSKMSSIFSFEVKEGYSIVTGGEFGPEGGLLVTLVLFVAIGIVYSLKTNKAEISDIVFEQEEENENGENI